MAGGLVLGEVWSLQAAELAAVLAVFLLKAVRDAGKSRGLWFGLLLFAVLCGFFRAEWCSVQAEEKRALFSGEQKTVTGILESLEEDATGCTAVLTDCRMEPEGEDPGKITLFFPADPGAEAGDRILVRGRCGAYEPASNPGEFDYGAYCSSQGIMGRMTADSWERTEGGSILIRLSSRLREQMSDILETCGGSRSGIFKAMLLGDRGDIPDQVYDLYRENGISHLLAISGLHVSMLGMGFYGILRKAGLGKGTAAVIGVVFMVCYGFMTGCSPSTRRAVIMFSVSVLSGCLGRTYDLATALGAAGAVLLWTEPSLLAQGGVQLSFLAVGGVGVLGRELDRSGICASRGGRLMLGGLAVQLATYPAVAYHYFTYPPYSLLLNLLVIPLMTYAMASGLLCLAFGTVSPAAGRLCMGSGYYILGLYEELCRLFGRLPGSSLVIGRPAFWQLAAYAVLLAVFAAKISRIRRKKSAVMTVTVLLFFLLFPFPQSGAEVTYLNVGQGDGIVVRGEGATLLIDGGSTDRKKLGEQILEPFLLSRGAGRVDYALVSHCDSDHISGLRELLESGSIKIGTVVLPALGENDEEQKALIRLAEEKGVRVAKMGRGDRLTVGALTVRCLFPEKDGDPSADRNDRSMVLLLEYGETGFLFTGDLGAEGERKLAADPGMLPGRAKVLKVGHHGSASSSCREFLEAAGPEWGIISYGEDNSYGHPAKETLDRLRAAGVLVLETARDGAVTAETDGKRLRIRSFLSGDAVFPGRM